MFNIGTFYYFSPTGGTYKTGKLFCNGLFEDVKLVDLCKVKAAGSDAAVAGCSGMTGDDGNALKTDGDVAVIAAPVYAGRIPEFVTEQIAKIAGEGKMAVTLAVYGNRAYEDALLELNNAAKASGFNVIASAALIAQHSIVPAAGAGRPDEKDAAEIREFSAKVKAKLESGAKYVPEVPGNYPYKATSKSGVTPIAEEGCILCGACEKACPVDAITIENDAVITDPAKCFMCLACTAVCPVKVRKLPAERQEMLTAMLTKAGAVDGRKENEFFL